MSSCIYQLTFRQLHSVQLSKNEKVFLGIRKEQLHLLKLMWIASLIPQALCETDSCQHVVTKSCSVRAKAKFMKTPKRSHSSSSSSWIFVQDKCDLVLSWYGCCQANLILEAFAGCEQTPRVQIVTPAVLHNKSRWKRPRLSNYPNHLRSTFAAHCPCSGSLTEWMSPSWPAIL